MAGEELTGGVTITFDNVRMNLGGKTVLEGLSCEVPAGEITVILGMSGAGKSVMMRLALGLLHPDAGRVLVGGKDLGEILRKLPAVTDVPEGSEQVWYDLQAGILVTLKPSQLAVVRSEDSGDLVIAANNSRAGHDSSHAGLRSKAILNRSIKSSSSSLSSDRSRD